MLNQKRVNKIPDDMVGLRKVYENRTPREGTCGPTIIAYLTGKTVGEIIQNWVVRDFDPTMKYRGYCSLRELEKNLNNQNFKTERIKSVEKKKFVLPEGVDRAIARIQWSGKYSHWAEEEKNTHFVLLDYVSSELQLFDNEAGLFKADDERGKSYMEKGKITSFLVV